MYQEVHYQNLVKQIQIACSMQTLHQMEVVMESQIFIHKLQYLILYLQMNMEIKIVE